MAASKIRANPRRHRTRHQQPTSTEPVASTSSVEPIEQPEGFEEHNPPIDFGYLSSFPLSDLTELTDALFPNEDIANGTAKNAASDGFGSNFSDVAFCMPHQLWWASCYDISAAVSRLMISS